MKIIARIAQAPGVKGGIALTLFDEHGAMLPNLISVESVSRVGEFPVLRVELRVDGDAVKLEA